MSDLTSPSLAEALLAAFLPDQAVVRDADGEHRAAAVVRNVTRGAERLRGSRASAAGRRVGLLVEPGVGWLTGFVAVLRAGGVVVPLSRAYPPPEIEWLMRDAAADTLITTGSQSAELRLAGLRIVTPAELAAPLSDHGQPAAEPPAADTPAMLLYTSGTTGKPKGAVLTHGNLGAQAAAIARAWGLGPTDTLLHALPLHHMHGIGISLLPSLLAGVTIHMKSRFEAVEIWESLAETTVFMGVPTMYVRLLEALDRADETTQQRWTQAARRLRLAVSGSAALPATVAERWRQVAGTIPLERFGMTEIGVGLSNPLDPAGRRVGRVGLPLANVDLRLVDDSGAPVERGPGELQLRGPGVFRSYWRRPEATSQAFVDGWFRTGDVAERDDEGVIRILGRTSVDIIKSGGYKLSALEIEEALRQHPAIADLAVVGLPDETWGERVVAAVVPQADRTACDTRALRHWAKQRLAAYKVPRQFVVVDELPRNALGKVVKPQLAAELARRAD